MQEGYSTASQAVNILDFAWYEVYGYDWLLISEVSNFVIGHLAVIILGYFIIMYDLW